MKTIEHLFSKYNCNVLIGGKSFFGIPVKNKESAYEKTIEIGKHNDRTTGNLLDYKYISKHLKNKAAKNK